MQKLSTNFSGNCTNTHLLLYYIPLFDHVRLHLADVVWSPEVTVVLGQNFRGLIAANEIVKVIDTK